jgi:hypothetical protein
MVFTCSMSSIWTRSGWITVVLAVLAAESCSDICGNRARQARHYARTRHRHPTR